MRILQRFTTAFVILFIILNSFPAFTVKAEETDAAPMFKAMIEDSSEGYLVKGTFTEFTSDIILVQTLYSLDQKNYEVCGENWNLSWLGDESEGALEKLQNQTCLYSNNEPLKSYLAGNLDCFYLKLRLTKEDGTVYESQTAVIDRGTPQPVPDELTPTATFAYNMLVREMRPFKYYGKYQLTVREDATAEEVAAFLPDTLPIEIKFLRENLSSSASGVVECPIAWKPFSLPKLTAGDSVTIYDAAEEIVVPGNTLVNTPKGIFQLGEPLHMDQEILTDEVRLVLNVIAKDEEPTGVLTRENDGLEMAFQLKTTGATAIRAYALPADKTEWTELPALPLQTAINAQPSTANSGYTLVLDNDQEPYRSYLAAKAAGNEPTPFFIGFKIEGGVYDGQQLILAWPDTYDIPFNLPKIGGSGGNEGNAGADNKDDSTEEGQRPNLPQYLKDNSEDNLEVTTGLPGKTENSTRLPDKTEDKSETLQQDLLSTPIDTSQSQLADLPQSIKGEDKISAQSSNTSQSAQGTSIEKIAPFSDSSLSASTEQTDTKDIPDSQKQTDTEIEPDGKEQTGTEDTPNSTEQTGTEDTPDSAEQTGTEISKRQNFAPAPAAAIACIGICIAVFAGKSASRRAGRTIKKS